MKRFQHSHSVVHYPIIKSPSIKLLSPKRIELFHQEFNNKKITFDKYKIKHVTAENVLKFITFFPFTEVYSYSLLSFEALEETFTRKTKNNKNIIQGNLFAAYGLFKILEEIVDDSNDKDSNEKIYKPILQKYSNVHDIIRDVKILEQEGIVFERKNIYSE